jgi:hypothetical protein
VAATGVVTMVDTPAVAGVVVAAACGTEVAVAIGMVVVVAVEGRAGRALPLLLRGPLGGKLAYPRASG